MKQGLLENTTKAVKQMARSKNKEKCARKNGRNPECVQQGTRNDRAERGKLKPKTLLYDELIGFRNQDRLDLVSLSKNTPLMRSTEAAVLCLCNRIE